MSGLQTIQIVIASNRASAFPDGSQHVLCMVHQSSCTLPSDSSCDRNRASGRLNNGIPMVPRRRNPSELDVFRRSLHVHERQEEIIQLIRENKVVLVVGETGSGKTTQVGQSNTFVLTETSLGRLR